MLYGLSTTGARDFRCDVPGCNEEMHIPSMERCGTLSSIEYGENLAWMHLGIYDLCPKCVKKFWALLKQDD